MKCADFLERGGDRRALIDQLNEWFHEYDSEEEFHIICEDRDDLELLLDLVEQECDYPLGFRRSAYPPQRDTHWNTLFLSNKNIHIGHFSNPDDYKNMVVLSDVLEGPLSRGNSVEYELPDLSELWK